MKINLVIESEKGKYKVDEILVDSTIPDFERKLFKVTNESTGENFYEGLSISRTNFAVEENRGVSKKDLWDRMINDIMIKSILDGTQNVEVLIEDVYKVKQLNPEDGSYKN